jgi:serine phosphatase RsbU (regulator of sigma subunit)
MIGLEPGARLLLVSKGVVEAKCRGEEYGLAGVKQTLSTTASEPAKNLCFKVLEQLQTFLCRPPTDNDVTALALAKQIAVKAAAQN